MSVKRRWVHNFAIILSNMLKISSFKLLLVGVLITPFALIGQVSAASANLSHSYSAVGNITNGSLVSLDAQKSKSVEMANTSNSTRLIGVAVAATDSLLAVDPTTGLVQVATSGNVNALVSNINGDIVVGDQIAVSPFTGVGMKAETGSRVIGLAQTAFSSKSTGASSQQVTDKNGQKNTIKVGFVSLTIAVGSDNIAGGGPIGDLQHFAKSLTGHSVSAPRVIISLIIAFIALMTLSVLIYSSIYGSIVAIGRNPLAKYAVFRSLGAILGMAALTAGTAIITIFLLLR